METATATHMTMETATSTGPNAGTGTVTGTATSTGPNAGTGTVTGTATCTGPNAGTTAMIMTSAMTDKTQLLRVASGFARLCTAHGNPSMWTGSKFSLKSTSGRRSCRLTRPTRGVTGAPRTARSG